MVHAVDLTDKRILITGASSGIGKACAVTAAALGARVILLSRSLERLEAVRAQLPHPERHRSLQADLTDLESIRPLVNSVAETGKLDGLIHSAGTFSAAPVGLTSVTEARGAFDLNVLSFLELMKGCSGRKTVNEGFSAVAVSSVAAFAGFGGGVLYSATKGALSAMVRSLAIELAPRKIRVNAVCPSNVKTPIFDAIAGELHEERALAELLKRQPLGLGEPEEIASAVCFLLSAGASFITGVNLPVDGGYLAQ